MICLSSLTFFLIISGFAGLVIWLASRNVSQGFKALALGRELGIKEERSRRRRRRNGQRH